MALHLAERKRYRDLITFVETWASHGDPSVAARLAVCEAYVGVRLLDRAWSRLKSLVEDDAGSLDGVRLATYLFHLRGWHDRAVDFGERALARFPEDRVLKRLVFESSRPDRPPEPGPDPHTLSAMVRLAESYMARGAFVRARGVLERARRRAQPRRVRRVEDLLWAVSGDFGSDQSLAEMCDQWTPEPSSVSQDATERGVVASNAPNSLVEGFRQLFRDLAPQSESRDDGEDTSVSRMAGKTELRGSFEDDHDKEHTEILRVVRTAAPRSGPLVDQEPNSVPPRPAPSSDYPLGDDYEDDSLVVITRQAPRDGAAEPQEVPLALHSDTERENEALDRVQSGPVRGARHRTPRAVPRRDDYHDDEDNEPLWPWAVAALGVMAGTVIVVFVVVSLIGW